MGRKTQKREITLRRGRKGASENRERARRIRELEDKLRALGGGTDSWCLPDLPDLPPEVREIDLEDIIAFESIETGTSLFEGLQEHGLDLPHPDKLNEQQCWEKTREVVTALAHLRVFLVGFEDLSPQEFYRTLWQETLWEGCYVEKRRSRRDHHDRCFTQDVAFGLGEIPGADEKAQLRQLKPASAICPGSDYFMGHARIQEPVRELGGVAFRAPRGQMQGGATQAMSVYIVEERQRSRCPRAAGTRRAHGGCAAIAALLVVNDVHRHRLLLAPCARRASPMRATPPNSRTGS